MKMHDHVDLLMYGGVGVLTGVFGTLTAEVALGSYVPQDPALEAAIFATMTTTLTAFLVAAALVAEEGGH